MIVEVGAFRRRLAAGAGTRAPACARHVLRVRRARLTQPRGRCSRATRRALHFAHPPTEPCVSLCVSDCPIFHRSSMIADRQEAGHELLRVESRKSQRSGVDYELQLDVELVCGAGATQAEATASVDRLLVALEAALGDEAGPAVSGPTRPLSPPPPRELQLPRAVSENRTDLKQSGFGA